MALEIAATISANSSFSGEPPTGNRLHPAALRDLRILWRCSKASSNGQDRLARNCHPLRAKRAVHFRQLRIHLSQYCIEAFLTKLLRLTNAEDARPAGIQESFSLVASVALSSIGKIPNSPRRSVWPMRTCVIPKSLVSSTAISPVKGSQPLQLQLCGVA